ncbi:MAG: sulfatase-like hydrolase/transferase [Bacteroidales bacterium]
MGNMKSFKTPGGGLKILAFGISAVASFGLIDIVSGSETSMEQDPKPNILFIFADDHSFRAINALNGEVKTPNLDRLASSGTTFTHAYNMGAWNGAVCIASRAMLITGSYIWDAYSYEDEYKNQEEPLSRPMWGNLMQQAGYETYFTGKWHIKRDPLDVFDHVGNVRPGMPNDVPEGYNRPLHEDDTTWLPWDKKWGGFWKGGTHWSEVLADDAVSFLNDARDSEKPFFMYLAFNAPHDPRQSPKEFVDMYPLDDISLPANFQALYPYREEMGSGEGLRDERLAPFPRTEYAVKVNRQEYYAIITHMDKQIGIILDELEKSGKADNTYIFFAADHGLAVGEHGLLGKQNMYDHSIRVPFIVTGPDIPENTEVNADIYYQDVMASSIDIAGLEKPEYVQFNSVMDLARGDRSESHYDAIYGAYRHLQRMIRKDGFKLIVYPEADKILLFDVENDPREINDLSGHPRYQSIKTSLFNDLIKLQEEMNDETEVITVKNSL